MGNRIHMLTDRRKVLVFQDDPTLLRLLRVFLFIRPLIKVRICSLSDQSVSA